MGKQFSDAYTCTFAQAAAAQYLNASQIPSILAKMHKVYAERARAMGATLKRELGDVIAFE